MIGISGSLIWSKTLMELIYLTPVVNFGEVRRAQLDKSILLTSTLVPLGFFRYFKVSSDDKERVGVRKATRSYRTYSIPGKTAALVPEFPVENLPLDRTAA